MGVGNKGPSLMRTRSADSPDPDSHRDSLVCPLFCCAKKRAGQLSIKIQICIPHLPQFFAVLHIFQQFIPAAELVKSQEISLLF